MKTGMAGQRHVIFFLVNVHMVIVLSVVSGVRGKDYISAVGDPGMRRDGLRLGFEAWNFCNEVGEEAPGMGSPRAADCFDLSTKVTKYRKLKISTQSVSHFLYFHFIYLFLSSQSLESCGFESFEKMLVLYNFLFSKCACLLKLLQRKEWDYFLITYGIG